MDKIKLKIKQSKEQLKTLSCGVGAAFAIVIFAIILANILYRPKHMVKRGFEIQLSADGKVIKKEEKPVDINALMKIANFDNGAKIFKKCSSCHSAEKGGGNKVGPNLFGVVGRKRGSVSGFNYSEAMLKKAGSWTRDDLNLFLTKPKVFGRVKKWVLGAKKKPKDGADVILYLETSIRDKK